MRAVHLHIDRIVVEGLPEARQRLFARALEERLRVWAASDAAKSIAGDGHLEIPTLNAGLLRPGATASQAAAQVVNSIARRVSTGGRGRRMGGAASAGGGEGRGHV